MSSRSWHLCRYLLKINDFAHFWTEWLQWMVVQLNIQISHGNAATDFRWGGRLYKSFFRSSWQNATVKGLLKSVRIYQSCHKKTALVFYCDSQCSDNTVSAWFKPVSIMCNATSCIATVGSVELHVLAVQCGVVNKRQWWRNSSWLYA